MGVHQQNHGVATDSGTDEGVLGHVRRTIVGASGTEVRGAHGQRQFDPRAPTAAVVEPVDRGVDVMVSRQPHGQTPGDRVDVEFAEAREQCGPVLVDFADDVRGDGVAEQDVAHHRFDEVALLLDDDHLVETSRRRVGDETPQDLLLERVHHAQLEDSDSEAIEIRLGQPHQMQGLAHVEVGLARGDDADAIVTRAHCDPIQAVEAGVLMGPRHPDGELILFQLHQIRAEKTPRGNVRAASERRIRG